MKKMYFTFIFVFVVGFASSQISNYSFTQSNGAYTPITGGIVFGSATSDDERFVDPAAPLGTTTVLNGVGIPIGFDFTYNGQVYNRIAINFNGWISLGNSSLTPSVNIQSSSNYTSISGTSSATPAHLRNRIAGVNMDFAANANSELRVQTIGTAPNQVCVIQWKNVQEFDVPTDVINFQIRLVQAGNIAQVVFGTNARPDDGFTDPQVGLGGSVNTDFNCRTGTSWTASTPSNANNNYLAFYSLSVPPSGLTFSWAFASCLPPAAVSFTSVTIPTANISWTAVTGALSYEYAITTSATPPASGTNTTATTASVAGLPAASGLFAHVRTNCGSGFSAWNTKAYFPCIINITPANAATNVNLPVTFNWSTVTGATSYRLYLSTDGGATYPLTGVFAAPPVSPVGLGYSTTYKWYVRAILGADSSALSCNETSATTFTTGPPPANCVPIYTTGCSLGDAFTNFKLNGESGGGNIDQTSTCGMGGYEDFSSGGSLPFLVPGTSYAGSATMQYTGDHMTIWIDYNDDGYYTDNERVINNLKAAGSGTVTPFTIYIPATATAGSHKMRIRSVDYGTTTAPTAPTDPCGSYAYGETEDYTVLIVAGPAAAYTVSDGTANACLTGGKITIDPASNNNNVFVPILDATGKIIASVNANGTNLGTVSIGEYVNTGAVRVSANSIKYLDRNIEITPLKQPVDVPVTVRLYLKAAELAALVAADPTVTGIGSLNVTKTAQACAAAAGAGTLFSQTGNGTLGADSYVQISIPSFSSFYLHGGTVALPVNYADLKGIRNGNKVDLTWITQSETNNRSFEIQRSADGRSFTAMGAVNSKAVGGNSVSPISYNFTDVLPLVVTNYYRLKQTDIDGKVTYSNTVLVKGLKPTLFSLNTIFPNPATDRVTAALQSPFADNITLVVTDITGKIIKRQVANMAIGDNIVTVDVASLPSGSYLLKAVCNNGCETAVRKFTKQ